VGVKDDRLAVAGGVGDAEHGVEPEAPVVGGGRCPALSSEWICTREVPGRGARGPSPGPLPGDEPDEEKFPGPLRRRKGRR
jgi:hypothetical protein